MKVCTFKKGLYLRITLEVPDQILLVSLDFIIVTAAFKIPLTCFTLSKENAEVDNL